MLEFFYDSFNTLIYYFYTICLQKLVSGLGLAVCRHGSVYSCNDVYIGERYVYASLSLMLVHSERPVGVFLFDVACWFEPFFKEWLMTLEDHEAFGLSIEARREVLKSVMSVLPPMHVNGHA